MSPEDKETAGATASSVKALVSHLRENAELGKHGHFYASLRRRALHIWCGVPAIVINLLLGSVFFTLLQAELPDWGKWLAAALAFLAAALGGIQTFFDFKRQAAGHRDVGNDYLEVARECERLLALVEDKLMTLDQLAAELPRLNRLYADVNQRAESLVVSPREYAQARAYMESRSNG